MPRVNKYECWNLLPCARFSLLPRPSSEGSFVDSVISPFSHSELHGSKQSLSFRDFSSLILLQAMVLILLLIPPSPPPRHPSSALPPLRVPSCSPSMSPGLDFCHIDSTEGHGYPGKALRLCSESGLEANLPLRLLYACCCYPAVVRGRS